jgi:alkylation response protein AidB-like acyl-CoA dehydrogenase
VAPAIHEAAGGYDPFCLETLASHTNNGFVLNGHKVDVPDVAVASAFLVAFLLDGEPALGLVAAGADGLTITETATIDCRSTGTLKLKNVQVVATVVYANAGKALGTMLAAGYLAMGAEALGMMDTALGLTIDYLKQRRQFGKPLASFQALQHRLADMAMAVEQVRSAVINAAATFDGDAHQRDLACSALKHLTGETGRQVAEEAIQMHGGMGVTADYGLASYARRLVMADHRLGDSDWHLARFAKLSAQQTGQGNG